MPRFFTLENQVYYNKLDLLQQKRRRNELMKFRISGKQAISNGELYVSRWLKYNFTIETLGGIAMANSLLAHLYSRIKGSQEDVATISLQYLVSQSEHLNRAFTQLLATSLGNSLDDKLQYICQSVGDDNERPDMSGVDCNRNERILCEMKFYAGLTPNQPLGYLERLKKNRGSGLAFICPKARRTMLWARLKERCASCQVEEVKPYCIRVDGVLMSLLTWGEVIECLRSTAESSEEGYLSDIYQLKGFCEQMDSDAFVPFTSADLNADNARKNRRYYEVIDETFRQLCADKSLKVEPVGKASTYFIGNAGIGYERKVSVDKLLVSIAYDHALWMSNASVETPFWVAISNANREQPETFQKYLLSVAEKKKDDTVWSLCYLALEPLKDATLDEVCQDLKRQILAYVSLFR